MALHTADQNISIQDDTPSKTDVKHDAKDADVAASLLTDLSLSGAYQPDPADLSITHPLEHKWVMYYDAPPKGKVSADDWQSHVKRLMEIETVEDFWGLYNNLAPAHELPIGGNYSLFKDGIKPAWEDPANEKGGKWTITLHPKNQGGIDELWLNTMLALIGESFEHANEICGAVVSIRKAQHRVSLWTRSADDEILTTSVGMTWKALLNVPVPIQYQVHNDARQYNPAYANNNAPYEV